MQDYICKRCGSEFDFASQGEGRFCYLCGAPLTYHVQEESPRWDNPHMRDYDHEGATA